jgi:hypothetical protein
LKFLTWKRKFQIKKNAQQWELAAAATQSSVARCVGAHWGQSPRAEHLQWCGWLELAGGSRTDQLVARAQVRQDESAGHGLGGRGSPRWCIDVGEWRGWLLSVVGGLLRWPSTSAVARMAQREGGGGEG